MGKKIRYILEAIAVYFLYGLFWILPYKTASNLGGWIGRFVGKNFAASRKALSNIQIAFGDKNENEQKEILIGMWDNLGRIMAEFPHLKNLEKNGATTIHNYDTVKKAEKTGKPIIFITGHIGNWEVPAFVLNNKMKNPLALVYRDPNNPWVGKLLQSIRKTGTQTQLRKGAQGAREIVKILKQGKHVGMLVDQKMNEGIPVPFFGKMAMTVTSVAQLAIKYDCIVIPCYCRRINKTSFDITFEKPFEVTQTGDTPNDIKANMRRINEKLETWIKGAPEQWLWLHRRWPHKKKEIENVKKRA